MIKKKWVSDNSKLDLVNDIVKETGLDESIARILVNRNIDSKEKTEKFLNPALSDLFDPYLLNDMDKSVERIKKAVKNKEKIYVYGDYDVDGVTASSIVYRSLKQIYNEIFIYIPERENEGYGLNNNAIDKIYKNGGNLIITVDCGITSKDEAEYAKSLGIDMIITDHHTCPDVLPSCVGVINPKRKDSTYPFSELCGAGVALKLVCALNLLTEEVIAIAAIGTIADIVPLISENRIIAYYGIEYLKKGILENINILARISGINNEDITARTISFNFAPKINAAGRMATAREAVEFFITKDIEKMNELASYLDELNKKRQECEKEIYNCAKEIVEKNKEYEKDIIIVCGNGWHEGVIGIVASRITEEYYKPCILISINEGIGKGSSRSIKGYNIYEALCGVKEYLVKFGGHSLAAGLTIEENNISEFKENILKNSYNIFKEGSFVPEIVLDCELKEHNINLEYIESLKKLEPFGMGNPEPLYLIKSAGVKSASPFYENKHMRLFVKKGNKPLEAVGFNMGSYSDSLKENDLIHIAAYMSINEFKGIKKIQARVKDIRLEK